MEGGNPHGHHSWGLLGVEPTTLWLNLTAARISALPVLGGGAKARRRWKHLSGPQTCGRTHEQELKALRGWFLFLGGLFLFWGGGQSDTGAVTGSAG